LPTPTLGEVDASPFFSLFSVLCLLVLLVAFFFWSVSLFFLILSHDFHEAFFLTTSYRTYLSRVQYIQNVLKYGMEKKKHNSGPL